MINKRDFEKLFIAVDDAESGTKRFWEIMTKKTEEPKPEVILVIPGAGSMSNEELRIEIEDFERTIDEHIAVITSGKLNRGIEELKGSLSILYNNLYKIVHFGTSDYYRLLRVEVIILYYLAKSFGALGRSKDIIESVKDLNYTPEDPNLILGQRIFEKIFSYYYEVGGPWTNNIFDFSLLELGNAFQKRGELKLAKNAYIKAIEFSPRNTMAKFYISSACFYLEQYQESLDWCIQLIKDDGEDAIRLRKHSFSNAFINSLYLNDYDQAYKYFSSLKKAFPNHIYEVINDSDISQFKSDSRFSVFF